MRPKRKRQPNPFKPNYSAERKARQAEDRTTRKTVREDTWTRAVGRCEWPTCRMGVTLAAMHCHEHPPRSLGGDPLDTADTWSICGACHKDLHGKIGGCLKRMVGSRADGMLFFERPTGNAAWTQVGGRSAM